MPSEYDTSGVCPECGATVDVLVVLNSGRCPECRTPREELLGTANDPSEVAGETPESQKPSAGIES